jgi:hypothetical protein
MSKALLCASLSQTDHALFIARLFAGLTDASVCTNGLRLKKDCNSKVLN